MHNSTKSKQKIARPLLDCLQSWNVSHKTLYANGVAKPVKPNHSLERTLVLARLVTVPANAILLLSTPPTGYGGGQPNQTKPNQNEYKGLKYDLIMDIKIGNLKYSLFNEGKMFHIFKDPIVRKVLQVRKGERSFVNFGLVYILFTFMASGVHSFTC